MHRLPLSAVHRPSLLHSSSTKAWHRIVPRKAGHGMPYPIAVISTHALNLRRRSSHQPARLLSTSAEPLPASTSSLSSQSDTDPLLLYTGPLTPTFKRLKIFSLSSLGLSFVLSPFIFITESSLPLTARLGLASIALATSGISTALVAWCGRPYVTALRRLPPTPASPTSAVLNDNAGLELHSLNVLLQPRITRVYDPAFLEDTARPFARWQLAAHVMLPEEEKGAVSPGMEETVAETTDAAGKVLGRWVVVWEEDGKGECVGVGRIQRHFNVHEELLDRPIVSR